MAGQFKPHQRQLTNVLMDMFQKQRSLESEWEIFQIQRAEQWEQWEKSI